MANLIIFILFQVRGREISCHRRMWTPSFCQSLGYSGRIFWDVDHHHHHGIICDTLSPAPRCVILVTWLPLTPSSIMLPLHNARLQQNLFLPLPPHAHCSPCQTLPLQTLLLFLNHFFLPIFNSSFPAGQIMRCRVPRPQVWDQLRRLRPQQQIHRLGESDCHQIIIIIIIIIVSPS